MPDHRSPYADAGSGRAAPLLATPLDIDGTGITAGAELGRELAAVSTIAESRGHLVAGLSYDDQQLDRRRRTLGASDIPAVVGLDPHRSALDVYLLKRGLAQPFEGNSFSEWGLRLEDVIAQKYADTCPGALLTRAEPVVAAGEPWMSATPDRYVADGTGSVFLLEIKNKSARQASKWGESGTDQVPFEIIAQATWQMIVTSLRRCDIAVLFGGNEFRLFHLQFDQAVADTLYDTGRRFWFEHVERGIEPDIDGSKSASEYLKQRFRQMTEVVRDARRHEEEWIRELSVITAQEKRLAEQHAALENKIKQAIGEDAGLQSRHGRITWKAPAPTTTVEWKSVAEQLRAHVAAEVYGNALSRSTGQRANSRRFLCRFANSDD